MVDSAATELLRSPALVEGSGQLLEIVRSGRAGTISGLAEAMGVARSTVIQRLGFLTDSGLVESEQAVKGMRGRPASINRFNPGSGVVLATQIGMSGCRLVLTDLSGTVLAHRLVRVDMATGQAAVLADLEASFDDMLIETGRTEAELAGIGVGIPSTIELLNYARALGVDGARWNRDFFATALWERYDAPVFIDLDVNLLGVAEWRGSWPDAEVFVCVKLGTLIDASIVVNGVPVRGAAGLAGELGHVKVRDSTAPCTCGGVGCLDAVASGSALVKQLAAAGFDVQHTSDVMRLAVAGEPTAVLAVREAGRRIGEALSAVVNLLNPTAVSTWGYLTEAETPLFAGIREGLYQSALPGASERLSLTKASLGDLAGARGAAMLVIDKVLEPTAIDRMLLVQSWSGAWKGMDANGLR
jgi:predicted NBD/HSP70 family sugar kinase